MQHGACIGREAGARTDAIKCQSIVDFPRYLKTCFFVCKHDLLDHSDNISFSPVSAVHSQICFYQYILPSISVLASGIVA